ncbi:hypothetical protein EB796_006142 [Bugula neritina]|uniref:Uncharacterized protein n=1 Tax=Bugula neritina TaxID=10212 RepID=A0A7J7KC62_BUGNE|nr:hypothetical protein EB796_006142 [Bugula neritina]
MLQVASKNCVTKDPVKLLLQELQAARLFTSNCKTIEYPEHTCGKVLHCLNLLFDKSGRTIFCHRKKSIDSCFKKVIKRCLFAKKYQELVIKQALPKVCKSSKSYTYKRPVLLSCSS